MLSFVLFLLMFTIFNDSFCLFNRYAALRDSASEMGSDVKFGNVLQFSIGSGAWAYRNARTLPKNDGLCQNKTGISFG